MSKFSKLLSGQTFLIVLIVVVLGFGVYSYSGNKYGSFDGFGGESPSYSPQQESYASPQVSIPPSAPSPVDVPSISSVTAPSNSASGGYSAKAVANPSDLLPQDSNNQWSQLNPVLSNNQQFPDLLQAGYHIGLDTIGQSLRNPNYQLRSDPIIPKQEIGPWNQSTIEPDYGRVPLEVGQGCR
jgi:hypothetical protein